MISLFLIFHLLTLVRGFGGFSSTYLISGASSKVVHPLEAFVSFSGLG